jgi:hypothetical protein
MQPTAKRTIEAIYSWPRGPERALFFGGMIATGVLMTTLHQMWLYAVLIFPTVWVSRAVIVVLMRVPQAEDRRQSRNERTRPRGLMLVSAQGCGRWRWRRDEKNTTQVRMRGASSLILGGVSAPGGFAIASICSFATS